MTLPTTGGPEWEGSEASPWLTQNEANRIFDAFCSRSIIEDRDLTAPQVSCDDGDRFLIDTPATGLWASHDGELAIALGANATNGWHFAVVARQGCQLFFVDESILIEYDGGWVTAPGGVSFLNDLTDVDTDLAGDGHTLVYDESNSLWYTAPLPSLGSSGSLDSDADGTLAANSDLRIPTQKAVKTYVDAIVTGLWDIKGSTDCSSNPNYPAASKGDAYVVTVAGKIGGASGTSVDIGDVYVALADNAGGTEAAVGTSWFHLEHNLSGVLQAANNLSDILNPTTARSNLGLVIGTNVQAWTQALQSIADLTPADGDQLYWDTSNASWFAAPAGGMSNPTESFEVAMSDMTTALTTGDAKSGWLVPYNFTLTEVFIGLLAAQSSSGAVTIDARRNGTTIFATPPSIDAGESTSLTGTAASLSITTLAKGDIILLDQDAAGTGAKGMVAVFVGYRS